MRNRKDIEKDRGKVNAETLELEVLLDIRDLLRKELGEEEEELEEEEEGEETE